MRKIFYIFICSSSIDSSVVMRNTWVPASKSESKKASNIPPAPPAPPAPPPFGELKVIHACFYFLIFFFIFSFNNIDDDK